MERSVEESIKNRSYIDTLRSAAKYSPEIIDLVESDIAYGLTEEQTKLYLKRNIKLPQMKMMSQCLRKGASDEFIELLTKYDMSGHQIQVAIEFLEKGISVENIETVVANGEKPAMMRKSFEQMLEKVKQVRSSSEVAPEYVKGLVKQIEEAVAKIQFQEERYDELNKKLKIFENSKKDEAVHDGLVKQLSDTEKVLNSQQENLNRANATISRLREQIDEKIKEMERMQNRISDLEDKLVNMATAKATEPVQKPVNADIPDEKPAEGSKPTVKADEITGAQTFFSERPLPQGAYQIPVYYQLPVVDANGRVVQRVQVERTIRKGNQGALTGFLGKLGIMKKSRQDIVKLLASGDLVPAQLVQIRSAIEKGLTEGQLVELINNNVSAEKMKEIIDIAVLENSMDY
ncbi:MAG: hypothetical protein GX640_09250 [Fibrobacter sp.]|nr:hypothetical protein [Fibrobacter sp.]